MNTTDKNKKSFIERIETGLVADGAFVVITINRLNKKNYIFLMKTLMVSDFRKTL